MNKFQLLVNKLLNESAAGNTSDVLGTPQIASSQFSGDRYAVDPQTGKSDMRTPFVLGAKKRKSKGKRKTKDNITYRRPLDKMRNTM
jgi:hypothetical protein